MPTEPLSHLPPEIEADLERRLAAVDLPPDLLEAVTYAVLGGGKRLRPILAVLCCQAVGGQRTDALASAGALELVHTFSLVHDDLPAMDDDVLRRGRPTLHVQAGEAMAILAGDVLLSLAFEWIGNADLDESAASRVTAELAHSTSQMVVGQVYDTLGGFPKEMSDTERLKLIHQKKTGALIRAACRIGAICGRANDEQLARLSEFGSAIGLMFQVVDDLLDVTQSAEHIGKNTGKDTSAGKLTFPSLYGIEGSQREVERLRQTAIEALAPLGQSADGLRELCEYLAVRTK
jgi:geranylgeranyl diphosphate synthase type II